MEKAREILIAGPCSAETRDQVLSAAEAVSPCMPDYFRAGVWKPRSRPTSFSGVGPAAMPWLNEVRVKYGLKLITEVATPYHVEWALKERFDALWLGARTTVSPLQVEEIFQAMKGSELPIFIKNPITPDLNLWYGAIERAQHAGCTNIHAVHRGFSTLLSSAYRNTPVFEFAWRFRHAMPEIPLLCDPCHMAGQAGLVPAIVEWCRNTIYNGFMIEVHPYPDRALSDPRQQLNASVFQETFSYRKKIRSVGIAN